MIRSGILMLAIASGFLLCGVETQNDQCSSSAAEDDELCCTESCPSGRYKIYDVNGACLDPDTTTEFSQYVSGTVSTTDAGLPEVYLCKACAPKCQRCNGSATEDCQQCESGYRLPTTSGASGCVLSSNGDGGSSIGIIIGAVAGGVGLLVVVVVVIVCCLLRRRRRREKLKRDQEQGPGMLVDEVNIHMDSTLPEVKGQEVTMEKSRPKKHKRAKEPDYANIARSAPRPLSIERGHEKVTRYTRDPTLKETPTIHVSPTEEKELADLPDAPPPPEPPETEYVITDAPTSNTLQTPSKPQPTREGARANDGQSRGRKANRTKPHNQNQPQQHPVRGKTTKDGAGGGAGGSADGKYPATNRRKTDTNLPYPAAAVSCPELPKFPIEEATEAEVMAKAKAKAEAGKKRPKKSHPKILPPPIPPAEVVGVDGDDGELSDPADDYINVPGEARLTGSHGQGRGKKRGVVNQAADLEEEPLEFYENQKVIDGLEEATVSGPDHRYSNTATPDLVESINYEPMDITASHLASASDNDNDDAVSTDTHPYVNVSFKGPPKS